jgi:SAM-dependent methyltransferase
MFKDSDKWLDRWLDKIISASGEKAILELGCGEGRDTQQLCGAGLQAVGWDKSKDAIDIALQRKIDCTFHIGDIRSDLSTDGVSYPVVIASLCLHYFTREETLEIVEKIHTSLADGGLLLVRVNSTDDANYGAIEYPEIESNYYQVNRSAKRFFDEDDLETIFTVEKWNTLLREKNTIYRYEKPKFVWELVLTKQ